MAKRTSCEHDWERIDALTYWCRDCGELRQWWAIPIWGNAANAVRVWTPKREEVDDGEAKA